MDDVQHYDSYINIPSSQTIVNKLNLATAKLQHAAMLYY
jgi:hypothetical protein